jgi:hypothetical protein
MYSIRKLTNQATLNTAFIEAGIRGFLIAQNKLSKLTIPNPINGDMRNVSPDPM